MLRTYIVSDSITGPNIQNRGATAGQPFARLTDQLPVPLILTITHSNFKFDMKCKAKGQVFKEGIHK